MPNFVWDRNLEDAWNGPYEGQEQIHRKAKKILEALKKHYFLKDRTFHGDEEFLGKSLWLLQTDALEAICQATLIIDSSQRLNTIHNYDSQICCHSPFDH